MYYLNKILKILIFILLLMGCGQKKFPHFKNGGNMQKISKIEKIFTSKKTICFGRFLIDVPSTATVVFGPSVVDADITRYPDDAVKIVDYMENLEKKIKEDEFLIAPWDKKKILNSDSPYGKSTNGEKAGQKIIASESEGMYKLHYYIPLGNDLFELEQNGLINTSMVDDEIKTFNHIAKNLRNRKDEEIPTESGTCIDGGFIARDSKYEWITIGVRINEFPDVHFSISATKKDVLVDSDALEPRFYEAKDYAYKSGKAILYSKIKIFRKGGKTVSDWAGFEVLARMPANNGKPSYHQFAFLSQGIPKDAYHPVLDVKLDTGVDGNSTGEKPSSLSDDEAIDLWDKLINSIRIRPVIPAKPPEADAAQLGSTMSAGQRCPRSGWWECDADVDREILGGRRQYFREGESMPQASQLLPQSLIQKMKGRRPTFDSSIPTRWQLVSV